MHLLGHSEKYCICFKNQPTNKQKNTNSHLLKKYSSIWARLLSPLSIKKKLQQMDKRNILQTFLKKIKEKREGGEEN